MKYRMYVDEVGNPDSKSSENILHRFLSLTVVLIDLNYVVSVLHPQMEQLKSDYFDSHPDDPVIFHKKELLNVKRPFKALRDSETRSRFDKALLGFLNEWDYTVISVCLNKKSHKDTYQVWRYDPYHYCLPPLLERYAFFLEQKKAMGDVMAESRGGKEDMRMKVLLLSALDQRY